MLGEGKSAVDAKLLEIHSEIEKLRTSFIAANPGAAREDRILHSLFLDDLEMYQKLHAASDAIPDSREALCGIDDLFPAGLTGLERAWLKAALRYDFMGRDALLRDLSNSSVSREIDKEVNSVFFVYSYPIDELKEGFHRAVNLTAYQESSPAVRVQIYVTHGRVVISQMLIAQVGGSGLDLKSASLDNCDLEAYSFSVEAVEAVQRLYCEGAYASTSGQLDFSGTIAMADGRRAAQTARIEELMRAAIPEAALSIEADPLPLATRFDVSLGSDGAWDYVAEVCCSLVGGFYHVQVRRLDRENGLRDESFPQQQYPNGWMLQRIRDALFADGYKPIPDLWMNARAWFGNRLVDTTFGDCLFTARISRKA